MDCKRFCGNWQLIENTQKELIVIKNIKKLKKTYVEVVPSLYLYKNVYLKVKLVTSYTILDPNRHIDYINYLSPFDIGIMLVKLKITL